MNNFATHQKVAKNFRLASNQIVFSQINKKTTIAQREIK